MLFDVINKPIIEAVGLALEKLEIYAIERLVALSCTVKMTRRKNNG